MRKSRKTNTRRLRCSPGFTLIEVAASIAILGGVIAGLLVARTRAQETCRAAKEVMICTRSCAARVAALRARLVAEGEGEVLDAEGYSWRITRTVLPEDAPDGLEAFDVLVTAPPHAVNPGSALITIWLPSRSDDEESLP